MTILTLAVKFCIVRPDLRDFTRTRGSLMIRQIDFTDSQSAGVLGLNHGPRCALLNTGLKTVTVLSLWYTGAN